MSNVKMSESQVRIRNGVVAFSKSQTTFAKLVRDVFVGYYEADSHNPVNVEFLLNEVKTAGHPRYAKAIVRLAAVYLPVDIETSKGVFVVTNRKGITKAKKATMLESLKGYAWDQLTGLLNHDLLKVGKSVKGKKADKGEETITFEDAVRRELAQGVTLEILMETLARIAHEEADKAAALDQAA